MLRGLVVTGFVSVWQVLVSGQLQAGVTTLYTISERVSAAGGRPKSSKIGSVKLTRDRDELRALARLKTKDGLYKIEISFGRDDDDETDDRKAGGGNEFSTAFINIRRLTEEQGAITNRRMVLKKGSIIEKLASGYKGSMYFTSGKEAEVNIGEKTYQHQHSFDHFGLEQVWENFDGGLARGQGFSCGVFFPARNISSLVPMTFTFDDKAPHYDYLVRFARSFSDQKNGVYRVQSNMAMLTFDYYAEARDLSTQEQTDITEIIKLMTVLLVAPDPDVDMTRVADRALAVSVGTEEREPAEEIEDSQPLRQEPGEKETLPNTTEPGGRSKSESRYTAHQGERSVEPTKRHQVPTHPVSHTASVSSVGTPSPKTDAEVVENGRLNYWISGMYLPQRKDIQKYIQIMEMTCNSTPEHIIQGMRKLYHYKNMAEAEDVFYKFSTRAERPGQDLTQIQVADGGEKKLAEAQDDREHLCREHLYTGGGLATLPGLASSLPVAGSLGLSGLPEPGGQQPVNNLVPDVLPWHVPPQRKTK